jgi:hypothetical protein
MSSSRSALDLGHADRLKRELAEFATKGALKERYREQRRLFTKLTGSGDRSEVDSMLDWFLFDWFDEHGESALDHFVASRRDLSVIDRQILSEWKDSINSVFEIRSIGKNSLTLRELDSSDSFSVSTITPLDQTPFKRGQFIAARLLPLGDRFIFSGPQFILPNRKSAKEELEIRRNIESLHSPEAIESAHREQRLAFIELFGAEKVTVKPGKLRETLQRFLGHMFDGRRDPQTGLTAAERFRAQYGLELAIPDMPDLAEELAGGSDVTILCDEFDGIVLLPDYRRLEAVFTSHQPLSKIPGGKEIVWKYVKDPEIPIVAFERNAERFPKRIETVFRSLLGDRSFSIEHLYAVLLHYKQPVEGIDSLKDDERLWDFFDGNFRQLRPAKPTRGGRVTTRPKHSRSRPKTKQTIAKARSASLHPRGKRAATKVGARRSASGKKR